ncbi:MAG TPA: hypothetical protein VF490_02610, partial [Chryseosolibacter sp.]
MNQHLLPGIPKPVLLAGIVVFLAGCQKQNGPITMDSPVPAKDAVRTFAVEPGFKVELVAAEPLVADPVAMEIDENGN